MNWALVRKIVRIIGSFVGLCIFIYLVYDGIKKVMGFSTPVKLSWKQIVLSLALYLLTYFFQIINFKLIYSALRQNVSLRTTIIGYSFSFLPKYIPGYVWGYYSRSDWFKEKAEIPGSYSWQASAIEVIVTVLTSFAIWLFYLFSKNSQSYWVYMVLATPFLVIIPINKLVAVFKGYPKTGKWLKNVGIVPFSHWLILTMNSYFQWVLFGLSLWMLSRVFSQTAFVNLREFFDFIYIFARSWLSGFLAIFIPNGLGIRELVLKDLLVTGNTVSKDLSTIIAALSRVLMLLAEFGWLAFAFIVNRNPKNRNTSKVLLNKPSN